MSAKSDTLLAYFRIKEDMTEIMNLVMLVFLFLSFSKLLKSIGLAKW